jgi:hypothetical protein
MSLQCAPCLSDLALVREAVTSIGGTATCTAHAVLMRYPSDDPGRRRRRLSDLRTLAEQRVVDATGTEKERLELLVQEYAVAEAMDLGAPDRTGPGRSNEPRSRRGKERRPGEPREPRDGRENRPPREPREPRPDRGRGPRPEDGEAAGSEPASASPDVVAAEGGIPAATDRPADSSPAQSGPPADGGSAASEAASSPRPASEAPAAEPTPAPAAEPTPAPPAEPTPAPPAEPTPAPARDDSAFGSPEQS